MRKAEALCERFGELSGLVVATFALAFPMERDRHHDIGRHRFPFAQSDLRKSPGKPASQGLDLFEFEEQDRTHQCALVHGKAAGALKRVGSVTANGAKVPFEFPHGESREGPSASLAKGLGNGLKRGEAGVTTGDAPGIDKKVVADTATCREDHADQDIRCCAQPGTNALG